MSTNSAQRSSSRPSTPHRLVARSAFVQASPKQHYSIDGSVPLSEEQFVELSDSMAVLDDNLIKVNLINESIVKFNESFSTLLYGLLTTCYCTEFTEAPNSENFSETYYDLDTQINLKRREIEEFVERQEAEKAKRKEKSPAAAKKGLSVNNGNSLHTSGQFKKPLTSATLSRLSKQKSSYLVTPKARTPSAKASGQDMSIMTNDSFIVNPSGGNGGVKRKNQFGTGGSSALNSSLEGSSQSRIPVRKAPSASKPAWK